jgi:hypothetical protein
MAAVCLVMFNLTPLDAIPSNIRERSWPGALFSVHMLSYLRFARDSRPRSGMDSTVIREGFANGFEPGKNFQLSSSTGERLANSSRILRE